VRSALLSVKGVSRADVQFEGHEAHVDYDPRVCQVEDLIAAVATAKDPTMPMVHFNASVKKN
jgi:copper chaperone CopZ